MRLREIDIDTTQNYQNARRAVNVLNHPAEAPGRKADFFPRPDSSQWRVAIRAGLHFRCYTMRAIRASWVLILAFAALPARAQQDEPPTPEVTHDMPAENTPPPDPSALVTVHGVVRNSATGEPLPRALVQIGGTSGEAALTDGDGRFEIGGVPPGPNIFQLIRPGFRDTVPGLERSPIGLSDPATTHAVFVLAGMADLAFAMKPTNVIRGQVELSTGESAQGINVMLLRRAVQDGRAFWRPVANSRTNADGIYRFAGLDDGEYSVYTQPAMEGDIPAAIVEPGGEVKFARNGFAAAYYPDARDFATAGHITVRGGDTAQANLHLALEPFHLVRAEVIRSSPRILADSDGSVNAVINDAQGHQLSYNAVYDGATHSVQALLPDGAYTLRANYLRRPPNSMALATANARSNPSESGQIDFTVQGRNLTRLRVPVSPEPVNTVQVNLQRTAAPAHPIPQSMQRAYVSISQAGGSVNDDMVAQFAEGQVPGTMQAAPTGPGVYWVHAAIGPGMCESSFTAGGANLAREPLIVNASGATAPLTLTLRDDCSSVHLVMQPNLPRLETGEEPSLTVYLVPDFDSTEDVTPITLRPSSGGSAVLQNLTPGSYHAYAFPAPVAFEYHNRDVLASLPSQQVTLDAGSTTSLVLEAPTQ